MAVVQIKLMICKDGVLIAGPDVLELEIGVWTHIYRKNSIFGYSKVERISGGVYHIPESV